MQPFSYFEKLSTPAKMQNPAIYQEAPEYCHYFFDLVPSDNLLAELKNSREATLAIFEQITPEQENRAYAAGKWTTNEVIRHIIDCERVYTYRALRFSRFDATELAGFEQDDYIRSLKAIPLSLVDLKEEYIAVRTATIALFASMTEEMLHFKARANNVYFTPNAIGFMTVGHNLHHIGFLQKNYLK